MMPMHTDPHTHDDQNCKRYWVPLQDFIPGHVFIYGNSMVANYKRGDVFQYEKLTRRTRCCKSFFCSKDCITGY